MRVTAFLMLTALIGGFSTMASAQMGGPPPQAMDACKGKTAGDSCGFKDRGQEISGTCFVPPPGGLVCAPAMMQRGGPGMGQGRGPGMERSQMGREAPQGRPDFMGGSGGGALHGAMPGEEGFKPPDGIMGRGYLPKAPYKDAKRLNNRLTDTGSKVAGVAQSAKRTAEDNRPISLNQHTPRQFLTARDATRKPRSP